MPPDLEQLVLSCLAKKPEDRPQSAAELDRRLAVVDVEPWTDVHAQQWWAATKASAGDLDGNIETHLGGHASGESDTRLAVDLREASGSVKSRGGADGEIVEVLAIRQGRLNASERICSRVTDRADRNVLSPCRNTRRPLFQALPVENRDAPVGVFDEPGLLERARHKRDRGPR